MRGLKFKISLQVAALNIRPTGSVLHIEDVFQSLKCLHWDHDEYFTDSDQ